MNPSQTNDRAMNDFLGQEVKVGDYVIFSGDGADIVFGIVEKITPKKAKIVYIYAWGPRQPVTIMKDHGLVCKVTDPGTHLWASKKEALLQGLLVRMKKEMTG
ncbi:MAG: hypothetical protein DDT31_00643 [Syntrophomonadaceae bacterium]|nr:hypothetical protein [Bacillota bacterium]